jgi:hypothetical protein
VRLRGCAFLFLLLLAHDLSVRVESSQDRARSHPNCDDEAVAEGLPGYVLRVRKGQRDEPVHPNPGEEHLFTLLDDEDPDLATALKGRYAERWLAEANLPEHRIGGSINTVELKVAPDFDEPGRRRLRMTSFYTGSTYWLYGWDGSRKSAMRFMDEMAQTQGDWVKDERQRFGPTEWDESPNRRRKRLRRAKRGGSPPTQP